MVPSPQGASAGTRVFSFAARRGRGTEAGWGGASFSLLPGRRLGIRLGICSPRELPKELYPKNGPAVAQCKVGMAVPFPSAQALLLLDLSGSSSCSLQEGGGVN